YAINSGANTTFAANYTLNTTTTGSSNATLTSSNNETFKFYADQSQSNATITGGVSENFTFYADQSESNATITGGVSEDFTFYADQAQSNATITGGVSEDFTFDADEPQTNATIIGGIAEDFTFDADIAATNATVTGTLGENFTINATQNVFNISVDGGAYQNFTLDDGNYTGAEIAAAINANITGVYADNTSSGNITLISTTSGASSTITIGAGANNSMAILGFTSGIQYNGTDLVIGNYTLDIYKEGGLCEVNFTPTDTPLDAGNVSLQINNTCDVIATNISGGYVKLVSNETGSSGNLTIGTASANSILGFTDNNESVGTDLVIGNYTFEVYKEGVLCEVNFTPIDTPLSAGNVSLQINNSCDVIASNISGGYVKLISNETGSSGNLTIGTGSANPILGFTDNNESVGTDLIIGNNTLDIYKEGSLIQVNFTPIGQALDAGNVSAQINLQYPGLASNISGGYVQLISNETGSSGNLTIGTASANPVLGFTDNNESVGTDSVVGNYTLNIYKEGSLVQINFTPTGQALDAGNVSAQINLQYPGLASNISGGYVQLISNETGSSGNLTIGTGSANPVLGFTDNNESVGTELIVGNYTFDFYKEGTLYEVNFTPTGQALDAGNVSAQINLQYPGLADNITEGYIKLLSNVSGSSSNITIGTGSANPVLGFTDNEYDLGSDGDWMDGQSYMVYVYANDTNAFLTEETYNVTIDDTKPAVSDPVTSDSDDIVRSIDNIQINVTVVDAFFSTGTVQVANNTNVSMSNLAGNTWSVTTNASSLGCSATDGTCTLRFTAIDSAGNINNSVTMDITIDNTAPNVTSAAVNDTDSKVRSTDPLNISVTVVDTNGIASVVVNGTTMTQSGDSWYALNTSAELGCSSDGDCILTFIATDNVSNVNNTETLTITIDDTAPAVTSPDTNDTDNIVKSIDPLNISVTVNDTNGVSSVVINGTTMTQLGNSWYTLNTSAEFGCTTDGDCILTVVATDNVSNVNNSVTLTITVDDSAPSVLSTYTSDSDNYVHSDDSLTIYANVSDTNNVSSVTVNGTTMTLSNGLWVTTNTTEDFGCNETGSCILTFTATDIAGNINNTETLTIIIDEVDPVVSLNYPDNHTWFKVKTPKLNYSFTDNLSPNASCVLTINSKTFTKTVDNNTEFEQYVLGASLSSGTNYTWSVTCTDLAGNSNTSLVRYVNIDSTKPATSLAYNSTTAETTYEKGPVNVTITTSDSQSGISHTQWRNSTTGDWTNVSGSFIVSNNLPDNIIYYRSVDNAGNVEYVKQKKIYIDNTVPASPTVTLSTVKIYGGGTVTIDASSTDALSGISTVKFAVLNASSGAVVQNPTALTLSKGKYSGIITAPTVDAMYNITLNITDAAGNIRTYDSTQLEVNTTAPSLTLDKTNASVLQNNSEITITLGGSNVNGWYNGTLNANISGNTSTITINTSTLTIQVWANNTAENVSRVYTYYVDSTVPTISFDTVSAGDTINTTKDLNATVTDSGIGVSSVTFTVTKTDESTTYKTYTDTKSPYGFIFDTFAAEDGNYTITVEAEDYFSLSNTTSITVMINNSVVTETKSTDEYGEVDFSNTSVESVLDTITGLNESSTVIIGIPSNNSLNATPSAAQLEKTIMKLNISADTPESSRVYFTILLEVLASNSISAPYSDLHIFADHGNSSIMDIGSPTYVDTVTKNGNDYARFYFDTDEFSIFFFGKEAETTPTPDDTDDDTTTTTTTRTRPSWDDDDSVPDIEFVRMWSELEPGETPIDINKEGLPITRLTINTLNPEENVIITVTKFQEKPQDLEAYSGKVYDYLEIDKQNIDDLEITSAVIEFRVSKTWLNQNSIGQDRIVLLRYLDNEWVQLETSIVSSDSEYVTYETVTEGFSYFAVGVKEEVQEVTEPEQVHEEKEPEPTDKADAKPDTETEPETEPEEKEDTGLNPMYIVYLFGFGIILAGVVYELKRRKKTEEYMKEFGVDTPKKSYKKLKKFIEDAISKGYSEESIRKALTDKGWDQEIVDKMIEKTE
ncbi:PGF-pre-PGF domain-containing protein, partial [Candidatus Woesearchaeota archaeon]|nr:PGF-pre-PGF domain-containing protein [Candidatus Woesearchaeota archaeon]